MNQRLRLVAMVILFSVLWSLAFIAGAAVGVGLALFEIIFRRTA